MPQKHSLKRKTKASELESPMTGMLELFEQEFKTTMINMIIALMAKVDSSIRTREMEILTLEIRNTSRNEKCL